MCMPVKKVWEKKTSLKKAWEQKVETKHCPYCDNEIKAKAIKCQYCWEFLSKSNKVSRGLQQDFIEESVDNEIEYKENSFASFITWTNLNRIWRAKYFVRGVIFMLFLYVCLFLVYGILSALAGGESEDTIMAICMIPFILISLYWNIILNNKRLHDYWSSWWLQLLLLVPIANIIVWICMYFIPWDERENQYWKPSETKTREEVLTGIFIVFLVICLIAAIASN